MVDVYGYSIATIPIIVSAVYGIIEFMKYFVFEDNSKFRKHIPIVATVIGGAIAICLYLFFPESLPVQTWYAALIMGFASGLSSVGVNQIKKQSEKSVGGDEGGS